MMNIFISSWIDVGGLWLESMIKTNLNRVNSKRSLWSWIKNSWENKKLFKNSWIIRILAMIAEKILIAAPLLLFLMKYKRSLTQNGFKTSLIKTFPRLFHLSCFSNKCRRSLTIKSLPCTTRRIFWGVKKFSWLSERKKSLMKPSLWKNPHKKTQKNSIKDIEQNTRDEEKIQELKPCLNLISPQLAEWNV